MASLTLHVPCAARLHRLTAAGSYADMAASGGQPQSGVASAAAHAARQQGRREATQQISVHGQPVGMHVPQHLNVLADVACTVQKITRPKDTVKSRQ